MNTLPHSSCDCVYLLLWTENRKGNVSFIFRGRSSRRSAGQGPVGGTASILCHWILHDPPNGFFGRATSSLTNFPFSLEWPLPLQRSRSFGSRTPPRGHSSSVHTFTRNGALIARRIQPHGSTPGGPISSLPRGHHLSYKARPLLGSFL